MNESQRLGPDHDATVSRVVGKPLGARLGSELRPLPGWIDQSRRTRPSSSTRKLRHALLAIPAVCLAMLVSVPLGAAQAAEVSADYAADQAQSFVTDYIKRHGLPGASYVVVKDGDLVTEGAAGDVAVDTRMSVGSLAKSFTAFAVLQLVDEDRIELDAPITQYIGGFSVRGADAEDITVRMLLSHTSGLPNPLILPSAGDLAGDVAHIGELEAGSRPGTTYDYSNLNYRTLARLVEVVSDEPFDGYLEAHVFDPLAMDHTRSVIAVSDIPGLDSGHVTAYGTAIALPELAGDIGGAGGVISTARDMGAWMAMQQRGGLAPDGTQLLSERLVTQSHTVQPHAKTYGFGWQHTSTAEPARIGHDGSLTRYSSRMDLVPTSGYGVAVLLDSYTPTIQHPFSISTGLIEISEGRSPEIGVPVATLLDLALGVTTLLVVLLGVRGVVRSQRWADHRRTFPAWRFALRQLPQLVLPILALVLFVGLTMGTQNQATPRDAYGLWPAATGLVLAAAVVGVVLVATRTVRRRRSRCTGVVPGKT